MSDLIKRIASYTARSAAFSKFVGLLEWADRQPAYLLRVLMYHRVDEPTAKPELYPGLISATPRDFDQQMQYLAANYHVVSMSEVLDAFQHAAALPPRAVLVTFDDAYRDFAEHAWPTLQRYRLPVTLFVPTAFPDHPERSFWWDRLYYAVSRAQGDDLDTPLGRLQLGTGFQRDQAFDRLKEYVKTRPHSEAMALVDQICNALGATRGVHSVLGWDMLRHLAGEGVTLAAHTQTHPLMNRISAEEVRVEACDSFNVLKREIGSALPILAYPSGGFNDVTRRVLEREGFTLAFTTVHGINDLHNADRLRLRRIGVGRRTSLPVLRAGLLSHSVHLNRLRPLPDI